MSRIKFFIIIITISVVLVFCYLFFLKRSERINYQERIRQYSLLLEKDPNNCFYLDQIAGCYQALYNFDQAIKYYKREIQNCPHSALSQFELGVCYYVTMQKELGLEWMNKAIGSAKEAGNYKLATMLQNEKVSWLEKWDLIKKMSWNQKKERSGVRP
jgi:tetratricopeptide (TPR) repeat protein